MNLIINYPKDKTILENEVAHIKALLMKKYIDDLNIESKSKILIKKELKKELSKT